MTDVTASHDVVIVGGAAIGSATAHFLTENPDFGGSVLVVERDPTYARASTTLSEASIRHQFSNPVNIRLSQFGTEFFRTFGDRVAVDGDSPDLGFRETGYMFLATDAGLDRLEVNIELQQAQGADVRFLSPAAIATRFPWMRVDDLAGASLGESGEGTIDGHSLLMGLRRRARANGAIYRTGEVVGFRTARERVTHVELADGTAVGCGHVVNAAGPRAALVARKAGLSLPVEPRRRSIFLFDCRTAIEGRFPLIVDVTGVHVRAEGPHHAAGGVPVHDCAVDHDDFAVGHDEFEQLVWPALAHRIPAFERVGVLRGWAGHYAYNTLDQNAIVGPAPHPSNFIFANGFSGHGLQQSPAVGRAVSELITYGGYRSLDVTGLGYERILANEPFPETAII